MRELMTLIGQIFLISCVQTIIEMFVDPNSRPYQARILSIACFAGSLYLLLQFIYTHILTEIVTVFNFTF